MIGDFDPEDEWDEGDPLHLKLDILERVVVDLVESRAEARHRARTLDALRLVVKLAPSRTERLDAIRRALLEEIGNG